jgi:hypothetical protein
MTLGGAGVIFSSFYRGAFYVIQEFQVYLGEPLTWPETSHEVPAVAATLGESRHNIVIIFKFLVGIYVWLDCRVVDAV